MSICRFVVAGALCSIFSPAHAAPKIFEAQDLMRMSRISEVAGSPTGERVAYVATTADSAENKLTSSIWLVDPRKVGAVPQRLTDGSTESQPEWSQDGRFVYFLSGRSGSAQVWRAPLEGGKPLQVTNLPLDVTSFRVSPRLDRIFVSMDVIRHCLDLACTAAQVEAANKASSSGVMYDQLYVRHWDTWYDGRRAELFSIVLDRRGIASATPVKLSIDLDGNTPSKPFGGRDDYTVSPDGQSLVFAQRNADAKEAWTANGELYQVLASGGERQKDGRPGKDADPVYLTPNNRTLVGRPQYSPDGLKLAYLSTDRVGPEAGKWHIVLREVKSGESRSLTGDWDESITRFGWTADGKSLVVSTDHWGQHPLWTVDARSGKAKPLTTDGSVESFSVSPGRIFYALSSLEHPAELYAVQLNAASSTRLTNVNEPLLEERRLADVEHFTLAGWNGENVHAYFVKPTAIAAGKTYPLAVLIHDGPHASMANRWNWQWNAQALAGAGFAVLMVDFHGSSGYGQPFMDSIAEDLVGKPVADLIAGVDAVTQKYSWLSVNRVCAFGFGYGGYLVNWLAGEKPDRFRCLVSHGGWFDNRSFFYSTDELWLLESEYGGTEFDNPGAYAKANPVEHVKNWRVPILFSHGQLDFSIPYDQSLAGFTAAQRQGVVSQLLLFPDENHRIVKPNNVVQWYDSVLPWAKSYSR